MTEINTGLLNYQSPAGAFACLRGRSIFALCALGVSLMGVLGTIVAGVLQYQLLSRAKSGIRITPAEASANDAFYAGAHFAYLILLLFSAICLLVWMHRAYKNLSAISSQKLQFSPGGTVGWWFCPFLNLVRPYQIMKEIFNVSRNQTTGTAIIGFWWACWIMGNILARVGGVQLTSEHPTIDELLSHTLLAMIDSPFYLLGGLLLLRIVYVVDRAQERQRNIIPTL